MFASLAKTVTFEQIISWWVEVAFLSAKPMLAVIWPHHILPSIWEHNLSVFSRWFMPVNIGITFLVGGILGWIVVKILRPPKHLEGLVIASTSAGNTPYQGFAYIHVHPPELVWRIVSTQNAGNLGNLLLIIIPAICEENGNPFGDKNICSSRGLSYVSFSMAVNTTADLSCVRTSSDLSASLET